MKLSKKQWYLIAAYFVVLLSFIAISAAVPFSRRGSYWAGYVFGVLAIFAQVPFLLISFREGGNAKSRFYGIPIARLGIMYLVAQLIVSLASMCLAWVNMSAWPAIVVSVLLLAAALLGIIAADITRDEIERQDTQLKKDVSAMRELRSLGNSLVSQCQDTTAKAELRKLADSLNYSDPVSSEATRIIESELKTALDEIQHAILDEDLPSIAPLCKKAAVMLAERNRLCKLNK